MIRNMVVYIYTEWVPQMKRPEETKNAAVYGATSPLSRQLTVNRSMLYWRNCVRAGGKSPNCVSKPDCRRARRHVGNFLASRIFQGPQFQRKACPRP